MKKLTYLIFLFFALKFYGCQDKNQIKTINTMTLKDSINVSESFIKDLKFNTYKYNGNYIENINIDSLTDINFKNKFFTFLKSIDFDKEQYGQVYFIKLLFVNIQQKNDFRLYNILNDLLLDDDLSRFVEDYELNLFELFLYKPEFFIKGAFIYKKNDLVDYINRVLPSAYFSNEEDFYMSDFNTTVSLLLIEKNIVDNFTIPKLKKVISQQPEITVYFSPSSSTEWKADTKYYYNILSLYTYHLSLNKEEQEYYNKYFNPLFSKYIFKAIYAISDPDGYTNLRKEQNSKSEIIQQIKSGENIEILDNDGSWWLVKTKNGNQGYVYYDRIKAE